MPYTVSFSLLWKWYVSIRQSQSQPSVLLRVELHPETFMFTAQKIEWCSTTQKSLRMSCGDAWHSAMKCLWGPKERVEFVRPADWQAIYIDCSSVSHHQKQTEDDSGQGVQHYSNNLLFINVHYHYKQSDKHIAHQPVHRIIANMSVYSSEITFQFDWTNKVKKTWPKLLLKSIWKIPTILVDPSFC